MGHLRALRLKAARAVMQSSPLPVTASGNCRSTAATRHRPKPCCRCKRRDQHGVICHQRRLHDRNGASCLNRSPAFSARQRRWRRFVVPWGFRQNTRSRKEAHLQPPLFGSLRGCFSHQHRSPGLRCSLVFDPIMIRGLPLRWNHSDREHAATLV